MDDRGDEAREILWAKLAEFEAESSAGDLPHRDLLWMTDRIRQDTLRIAALEREKPVTKRDTPSLGEIFAKLYPDAPTPPDERILLTGYAVGFAAKAEDDLQAERRRFRSLVPYVSHPMFCAKQTAVAMSQVECTCGLDAVLAGVKT